MSDARADGHTAVRLFVGKGGAGKTTLAAKAALDDARSGARSLVVSFDQSHSLVDVLGVGTRSNANDDGVVSAAEGLDVLELDTLALVESRYSTLSGLVALAGTGHEHGVRFGGIDPEEIVGAPGVQEMLGLQRIVDLVDSNRWDTVHVDLPATADALRTLQLPDLVCGYLERLWPRHDRIVAGTGTDPRLTVLVAVLESVVTAAERVREILFAADRTSASLVMTPERVAVAETRRILSAAALTGLPVDTVIVNRVLPTFESPPISLVGTHPAVFWFESWQSEQRAVMSAIEAATSDYSLVIVEQAIREPVGLDSLGTLVSRFGGADVTAHVGREQRSHGVGEPVVAHESGSGLESVYSMTIALPVVDPATLELGRVEDDVIIGADGTRRRVRLVSVLRRCEVVGAEF
ncbi:MAG: ArsA-related P-loop ATPase, partial [Rhodococcus sp. (in: high G+C Gram-positive bacteria)]